MEKLTIIQEARLKCLQMANDYYTEANKTMKYEPYSHESVIYRSEQYLKYILEDKQSSDSLVGIQKS